MLVRQIAGPAQIGDTIKRQIDRASRRIPFWSYRRVKGAWYAECARIDADEIEQLRKLAADRSVVREAKQERANLLDRIARLEAALGLSDEDFNRPQIDALRGLARPSDSPVD